jgi:hypothetical protein
MKEMPSLNMSVQRLKVTILPLDLPYPGPVTHSGEILTTGKSHGKKPDRFSSPLQNFPNTVQLCYPVMSYNSNYNVEIIVETIQKLRGLVLS